MEKLTLEQVINKVDDIPALPSVVSEIMALTEDPDSTPQDIEKVVLRDQSLTARVLRLANSAYYGFPRRISTISEATILLGFRAIRSITLSAAVSNVLVRELPGYKMPKGELWRHSQTCAITARHIARKFNIGNSEEIYVAGLLHDIGKVIMSHYIEDAYIEVVNKVINENITFLDAEEEILGFNHAQVGYRIAEKWNLPPDLVEAIAYHHSPEDATLDPHMTCITHIADAITMMMGIGLGVDGMAYSISDYAIDVLDIDTDIDSIIAEISDIIADESSFSRDDLHF